MVYDWLWPPGMVDVRMVVAREGGGLVGRCMALGPEVACKASDNIPAK